MPDSRLQGILAGMDNLRAGNMERDSVLMLLTDGQPTTNPPSGYVFEMNKYLDSHPGFTFQLNSFGFGYNLNSELLLDLAVAGAGTYAFIPDSVIVGTTFVNSVSNILSSAAQNAYFTLPPSTAPSSPAMGATGITRCRSSRGVGWLRSGRSVRAGPGRFRCQ